MISMLPTVLVIVGIHNTTHLFFFFLLFVVLFCCTLTNGIHYYNGIPLMSVSLSLWMMEILWDS